MWACVSAEVHVCTIVLFIADVLDQLLECARAIFGQNITGDEKHGSQFSIRSLNEKKPLFMVYCLSDV